MAWLRSKERLVVGIGAQGVRMLVARHNGGMTVRYDGYRALPDGAVRAGLRSPAFADPDAVATALSALASDARERGSLRRPPELTSLLVGDGCFRLAASSLDGEPPTGEAGARMARWMLRDLLPVGPDDMRIDWSVHTGADGSWLFGIGAVAALLDEYEGAMRAHGWNVGRVLPWTLCAGAAIATTGAHDGDHADRRFILCDGGGALACLVEIDGVPRVHRTWRTPVPADQLAGEIPALRRYVGDHLEITLDHVWLCGSEDWLEMAARSCEAGGLRTSHISQDAALLASLEN